MPYRHGRAALTAALMVLGGDARAEDFKSSCEALTQGVAEAGRVTEAKFLPAATVPLAPFGPPGVSVPTPDHCLVRGKLNERTGIDGKPYAIGYELRLPAQWNGKFLFEGGGGSDGVLRPALDVIPFGAPKPNAISAGYAAATTDAGHLDEPGPLGPYLFGLDPKARADKGYSSIPPVDAAAKALIAKLYGKQPARSYFAGCSNGGRQAMAVTQRYPDMFDGVVSVAPAYRVPLAAIDAIGQTQTLMKIAPPGADGKPDLGSALLPDDLKLVSQGVLAACEGADGLKDGMVRDPAACKFDPATLACKGGQNSACLAAPKLDALKSIFAGTKNAKGELVYSDWPWDPGVATMGWRMWKLGVPKASPPNALNVTLIPGSIAYVFSVPPEQPADLIDYEMKFDFDRDTAKVMKGGGGFEAGMEFEAAASTNLDAFRARGGRMIFVHGMADPIFSARDTIHYLEALKARYADADAFSRLFLVPGMNHCAGGPATDQYDAVSALDAWIEKGEAPAKLIGAARKSPDVPWPGRTRPLCAYPKVATYKGAGDVESAESFECR